MAKNKPKRDKKGDMKFAYKANHERDRYWRYTYVFKYFDSKENNFRPYFNLEWNEEDKLEQARRDKDFMERVLYATPESPPFDEYIKYHNWLLGLLVENFKESFDIRAFEDGFVPTNKYFRVILPKKKDDSILAFVKEYGLEKIQDLIFEIIATGQKIYTEDVFSYENKEFEKRIKNIHGEVRKLNTVLERTFDNRWIMDGKKPPPSLQHISFVYHNGKISIEDPWLGKDVLLQFKNHLENDSFYKNWKLELEMYSFQYDWVIKKLNFKYDFALSLYKLLKRFPIFKSKAKTPNRIMSCIVELFELASIKIGSEGSSNANKVKVVRNWIDRKVLKEKITFLKVKPNKKRLLKYFDSDFIEFTTDDKRADALIVGGKIAKRFDLFGLKEDLAHIAQCLKESSFTRSAQLSLYASPTQENSPEIKSMLALYNAMKSGGKFSGLSFKVNGDDQEYQLKANLPLFIIESALKNHLENHEEDFEVDIFKGTAKHLGSGNYETTKLLEFKQPEERFMVKFVTCFYDYLLNENPPKEYESFPSEKYYAIIAVMLQQTWFFRHIRDSEDFVISKVKAWHRLSLKNDG